MRFVGYLVYCIFLSGDRYLCDGDTDRHEILHGTYRSRTLLFPFWGSTPRNPKIQNFVSFNAKTVSCSVTCQLELIIITMRAFQKCIAWDGSPQGESPMRKNMYFCPGTYLAPIGVKICMVVESVGYTCFLHFWCRYL